MVTKLRLAVHLIELVREKRNESLLLPDAMRLLSMNPLVLREDERALIAEAELRAEESHEDQVR